MDMPTRHTLSGREDRPSIGELIRRLVEDMAQLFRTELRLAQSEMRQNLANLRTPLILMAFGALLLVAALFTLMGALVGWLTPLVGPGWAAFIVAVAAGIAGLVLLMLGKAKLDAGELTPVRTMTSLKQDAQALKGNKS